MNSNTSEQTLLDVEHSAQPAPQLLENVANVLRIDLSTCCQAFFEKPEEHPVALKSAPREEWALRWLLKKTPQPLEQSGTEETIQ